MTYSKQMTMRAAIAAHVDDGDTVARDGFTHLIPVAAAIGAQPPLNVRAIRKVARHAKNAPPTTSIKLERTTFQLLFDTADHSEGIAAFRDKRRPNYQGK